MRRRALIAGTVCLALIAGCSNTESDSAPTSAATDAPSTVPLTVASTDSTTAAASGVDEPAEPTFTVRPGTLQLALLGAEPGTQLTVERDERRVGEGTVDEAGGLVFRQLEPGTHQVITPDGTAIDADVMAFDDNPPQSFFDAQVLEQGFGYITARDGTTLSANVLLPGDAAEGPYPTVVEYSGYSPSDPDASGFGDLFTALGFAYVGVNIRGTGCSGGSFQFFEPIQSTDGYDVIEAVAAQDWVAHGQVGMVGISYPGISQLFVAQTQPPHLAAITPLSVLDDSYAATLYPGGILNTGFAVPWAAERQSQAEPFGQAWTQEMADGGDEVCAANQELRLQNPDAVGARGGPSLLRPRALRRDRTAHVRRPDQRAGLPGRRLAGRADRRTFPELPRSLHLLAARLRHARERAPYGIGEPGHPPRVRGVPLAVRGPRGARPDRGHARGTSAGRRDLRGRRPAARIGARRAVVRRRLGRIRGSPTDPGALRRRRGETSPRLARRSPGSRPGSRVGRSRDPSPHLVPPQRGRTPRRAGRTSRPGGELCGRPRRRARHILRGRLERDLAGRCDVRLATGPWRIASRGQLSPWTRTTS